MARPMFSLQYYPGRFFLNAVHPLAKFTAIISLSAILFITQSAWAHAGIFSLCVLLVSLSPVSFFQLQGSRLLMVTTIFIALLQILFRQGGDMVMRVGVMQITQAGLINAVSASARFLSVILLSYLFVLTTEPGSFVLALVRLGLPYRFGFTVITALRMNPMIKGEVRKILFAQRTRGVSYRLAPLIPFISNISQFLQVVLISMVKRVNQLVISMEGRSFGLHDGRTFLGTVTYRLFDYLVIAAAVFLVPIVLLWR